MSAFLERLAALSSAEQILEAIGVAYDPALLNVHRLHILRGFRDRIAPMGLAGAPDQAVRAACLAAMTAAYADFAAGGGPKTFRVFRRPPAFVPLAEVKR